MPYAGGTLSFYASGTSTPQSTFSTSSLSVVNANPVVLDSAGRASNVFLSNLAYKVVLADVLGNQIWTADPVATSDFTAAANFLGVTSNPNGNLAGTAASSGIPASAAFDTVANILYICTTTGTATTAVWTAINASTPANAIDNPRGYLTPVSGTPIITADSIASASLVYTPYIGNTVPLYTGSVFTPTVFAELTLSLAASHAASTIYDVFMFSNSGVVTLATGPAWTNNTAGSCARGTGAATTQLQRITGILVNAVSMTGRNGATTYTIGANLATYLGSIFIDTVAGQVTCHRSWGQSRKWGIWNAYSRAPILLKAGDSTANWAYASATVRASNGNSANSLTIFSGLAEEEYDLALAQQGQVIAASNTTIITNGIGFNVTNAYSGKVGSLGLTMGAILNTTSATLSARYITAPSLGINTITACEAQVSAGSGNSHYGTEANMVLSALWRG